MTNKTLDKIANFTILAVAFLFALLALVALGRVWELITAELFTKLTLTLLILIGGASFLFLGLSVEDAEFNRLT